jgi:hypothetical protein
MTQSDLVVFDFPVQVVNDTINFAFSVLDTTGNICNFSGYTSAKMTLKTTEYSNEVISFSSTGSTYTIDISNRNGGAFTLNCLKLAIPASTYLYDFQLSNSTKRKTIMRGFFPVCQDITS